MTHIDEDELRRGLRELAGADGTAGAAPPTGAVVALGRRTRHRRRALAAGAATVLVATGSVLGLRWTGGPAPSPDSVAATTSGSADPSDLPLRLGPAEPEIGAAYAYDLVGSCRYRYAVFGGREWVGEGLRDPVPDSGTRMSRTRTSVVSDRLSGHMRLVSEDTAVFEFGKGSPRPPMTFRPAPGGSAPCPGLPAPHPGKPAAEEARAGVWYPHGLYVHCGLRHTVFDGRTWRTARDYQAETGMDGSGRHLGVRGFARMTGDSLRFEAPGLPRIDFVPAAPGEEPPACA
ncbi:hypothetical protein [Streptomyces roseolilacinus]|uniref:Uncharacterized protein n=1 Tax=Streptomyces roseolilacinus TaxID=66904 RepID=A0A918EJQ7_9ACTN|nr:hypothetical protein [Streptomyces roseolilacinus]GGP91800.1 hypothetical protein GCM10010249_07290 [Streptomyces roseolilacinus]